VLQTKLVNLVCRSGQNSWTLLFYFLCLTVVCGIQNTRSAAFSDFRVVTRFWFTLSFYTSKTGGVIVFIRSMMLLQLVCNKVADCMAEATFKMQMDIVSVDGLERVNRGHPRSRRTDKQCVSRCGRQWQLLIKTSVNQAFPSGLVHGNWSGFVFVQKTPDSFPMQVYGSCRPIMDVFGG